MPIGDFGLTPKDIEWHGKDLSRPECVLATRDGTLWCADDRGGVTRLGRDGGERTIGKMPGLPNGVALERGGSFLVCDLDNGKLNRLYPDGRHELVLDQVDGKPLAALNFVLRDGARVWGTVMTRHAPRREALEKGIADGFVFLLENGKARIAADGFFFTNEVRVDRARKNLYVVETGHGRIVRLPIAADGSLGKREVFGPDGLFPGARLDGCTFDAEGNLWVTEITRNGIHVIEAGGARCRCVFEDPAHEAVDFPASLVFAGDDLKTVYIGTTRLKRLGMFRSPVAGEPLDHWNDA